MLEQYHDLILQQEQNQQDWRTAQKAVYWVAAGVTIVFVVLIFALYVHFRGGPLEQLPAALIGLVPALLLFIVLSIVDRKHRSFRDRDTAIRREQKKVLDDYVASIEPERDAVLSRLGLHCYDWRYEVAGVFPNQYIEARCRVEEGDILADRLAEMQHLGIDYAVEHLDVALIFRFYDLR